MILLLAELQCAYAEVRHGSPVTTFGGLPFSFEPNEGQTDRRVDFISRGPGYTLFITSGEAVLKAGNQEPFRMQFLDRNRCVRLNGYEPTGTTSNYFVGNDRSEWRTAVPHFQRVIAEGLYSGIDLVYYGSQMELEYDFVVHSGADPHAIRMAFPGAKALSIDRNGDLVLSAGDRQVRHKRPIVYQELGKTRKEVPGRYVLRGRNIIGFKVAQYDRTKPLIIDPVLEYGTYLGGSGDETARAIATDSSGNVYIAGATTSLNFPVSSPAYQPTLKGGADAFITKLNASGTAILYSTYLGGSSYDQAWGLAVDAQNNIYVTGTTRSPDFPIVNPFQHNYGGNLADAFVAKIASTGDHLIYSTFLGGSGFANGTAISDGTAIAVDSAGNAYVTGYTSSIAFPTVNASQPVFGGGSYDAYVAKFDPNGACLFSTYFGGSGADYGEGIAVDPGGNIYVAGYTTSSGLATPGAFQAIQKAGPFNPNAFVLKLSGNGSSKDYFTYLGGSVADRAFAITVDAIGSAYVTGETQSPDFPVQNAFQGYKGGHDAFVARLDAAGSALIYASFLGGSSDDTGAGITVDSGGNAYVAGDTDSADFPIVSGFQTAKAAGFDAIIAKLSADGALLYSTYYGGNGDDYAAGIAVDLTGTVSAAGFTTSTNLVVPNALQPANAGGGDAFIAKLSDFSLTLQPLFTSKFGVRGFNVIVAPLGPFNGIVTLTCSIPGGQSCALNPTSVAASGVSLMTGPAFLPDWNGVTVTGTSGSLKHTVTFVNDTPPPPPPPCKPVVCQ
jgi:hypothetical protein